MTEKLTFHQVAQQHESDPTTEPTVLVERSDGRIHPARLTSTKDEYGRYLASFTDIDEDGNPVDLLKPMSRGSLSDRRQAELADDLARSSNHNEIEDFEDTAERARDIPDEVVHEAGEKALVLAEIEEPLPGQPEINEAAEDDDVDSPEVNADVMQSAKAEYMSQTRAVLENLKDEAGSLLGRMSQDLEEADGNIQIAGQVVKEENVRLTRLVGHIESGQLPPVDAMRYIEDIQQTLHGMKNRLQAAEEIASSARRGRMESAQDMFSGAAGVLSGRDQDLHGFIRDQGDGVVPPEMAHLSTEGARSEIQRIQNSVDEIMPGITQSTSSLEEGVGQLTVILNRLDEFVGSRGAYGTDSLRQAVATLRSVDLSRSGFGAASQALEDVRTKLRNIELEY